MTLCTLISIMRSVRENSTALEARRPENGVKGQLRVIFCGYTDSHISGMSMIQG